MAVGRSKPFDDAQDVTQQLLTLSSAIVSITVAFSQDLGKGAPHDARIALSTARAQRAVAIVAGVATLLNRAGRVGGADSDSQGIRASGITFFAGAQIVLFVLAICATIYFGARSFDPTP